MSTGELRMVAVLGLVALGLVAILAALALLHLQRALHRLKKEHVARRALPSLRGDARTAARLVDHRQAAWRLRC